MLGHSDTAVVTLPSYCDNCTLVSQRKGKLGGIFGNSLNYLCNFFCECKYLQGNLRPSKSTIGEKGGRGKDFIINTRLRIRGGGDNKTPLRRRKKFFLSLYFEKH